MAREFYVAGYEAEKNLNVVHGVIGADHEYMSYVVPLTRYKQV